VSILVVDPRGSLLLVRTRKKCRLKLEGAFGIPENKVRVGLIIQEFFFGLDGFSTGLLFPGDWLEVRSR